jgi:hypothetical protein
LEALTALSFVSYEEEDTCHMRRRITCIRAPFGSIDGFELRIICGAHNMRRRIHVI